VTGRRGVQEGGLTLGIRVYRSRLPSPNFVKKKRKKSLVLGTVKRETRTSTGAFSPSSENAGSNERINAAKKRGGRQRSSHLMGEVQRDPI